MAASATVTNLSQVSATLKEVLNDKEIKRQVDVSDIIVGKIKSTSDYATGGVGRKALVPTTMATNRGGVARLEGETLGVAGSYTDVNAEYNYKSNYFRFQVTGQSIASTSTDVQALSNVLTRSPKEALLGFGIDISRQVYGTSLGGARIAKCGTTSASTTVNLDPRTGNNAITRGWLDVGMWLDIGTAADPDSQSGTGTPVQITAVTESTTAPTITVSSAVTTSSSHFISVYDNRVQADGTSKELTSLNQICDASSTIGGLAPGTHSKWKGTYDGNSGTLRSISTDTLLSPLNRARQKGATPDLIVTSLGVQQKYYTTAFLPATRYIGNAGQDQGDQTGPTFAGMTVNASPGCPTNQLFILSTDHLAFHVPKGENPNWIPGTDGILHKVANQDAFEAQGYWYAELGTNHRAAQVLVDDISE